jgi:lysophospholipase L1-like esterase
VDARDGRRIRIGYPGVTLRLRFEGPSLALRVAGDTGNSRLAVMIDGGEPRVLRVPAGESDITVAEGLGPGPHTVDVVHRTEAWQGIVTVLGFRLAEGGRLLPPLPWPSRKLLFIGDSVTCGEGVDREGTCEKDAPRWSNALLSYGMLTARALDAQAHLVCHGGRGLVRDWEGRHDRLNAPDFFDLAVADEARAPWDHGRYVPDAVLVSLGTNDFNLALGPLPEREPFVSAYVRFVRRILARYPRARVLLTEGAIVDDADPARPRRTVLRDYIAETVRRLADPRVRAIATGHQPGDSCDAHPTRGQHAAMARELEPELRRALGW